MTFIPSPSQQRAIRHQDGPLLVLAGPGSGKTTVMIHRMRHLIEVCHVPPEQILAISFTNASVRDLSARFLHLTNAAYPQLTIRTFHSLFYAILKQSCRFGIPALVSSEAVLRQMAKEGKLSAWARFPLKELAHLISEIKTGIFQPSHAPFWQREQLVALYTAYEARLRGRGEMDLDDLLVRTEELLADHPEILEFWQRRFSYILVDEFQDISGLQFEIIRMLAGETQNLFAVGDDDQAIYRFRGADASYMLGFDTYFRQADVMLLETDFRCPDTVVAASMRLIAHNKKRYDKRFVSAQRNGSPIRVWKAPSGEEEAKRIAAQARQYIRAGGSPQQFAVLARSHRQFTRLHGALKASGVAYHDQTKPDGNGICLTTMHGAKGLEFDEVTIMDVNEGFTPYARGGIVAYAEEERRLFYVAVTRAKRHLSLAVLDPDTTAYLPSRFLKEMNLKASTDRLH